MPHVSLSVLRVLPRCHRTAVLHIQLPVVTFFLCVTGDKILASSYIPNIIRISANHPYCLCGQGESPLYRELMHSNASPPQAYIPMCPSPYTNQPVYSIAPSPSIFDVRSVYHLRHNVLRPVRTTTQSTILPSHHVDSTASAGSCCPVLRRYPPSTSSAPLHSLIVVLPFIYIPSCSMLCCYVFITSI